MGYQNILKIVFNTEEERQIQREIDIGRAALKVARYRVKLELAAEELQAMRRGDYLNKNK